MEFKNNLERTINTGLEQMNQLNVTSTEFKNGANNLSTLMESWTNMEKLENELYLKREEIVSNHDVKMNENDIKREENDIKRKQMKSEGRHKWADRFVKVLDIAVPATITVVGTLLTFAFEENGCVSTQIGRDYLNRIVTKR